MLQTETIKPGTLSVLKSLMEIDELRQFSLVGGTALSLKYGHRLSIDLDLFSVENFEREPIIKSLENKFGDGFEYRGNFAKWGIFCQIEKVKVDIVHYPHAIIQPIETDSGIRLYHDKDLIAMKIQAILGRGVKKDFWDIHELLKHFSIDQMLALHQSRYEYNHDRNLILENMTNFGFADEDLEPICLRGKYWAFIKEDITEAARDYLNQ